MFKVKLRFSIPRIIVQLIELQILPVFMMEELYVCMELVSIKKKKKIFVN